MFRFGDLEFIYRLNWQVDLVQDASNRHWDNVKSWSDFGDLDIILNFSVVIKNSHLQFVVQIDEDWIKSNKNKVLKLI